MASKEKSRSNSPVPREYNEDKTSRGSCSFTQLKDCSDRLTINDSPSCEQYTQLLRLRRVTDLDKLDPDELRKTDLTTPVFAAEASLGGVQNYLACSMIKSGGIKSFEKYAASAGHTIWNLYQNATIKNCASIRKPTFCHDIELAIAVNLEQCWQPRGYSRGELLNSISLAPGEELSLEFFTYDRHKLERERENEGFSESNESGSVTARTSTEVVNTTQFKVAVGAEAKGEASLSLKEMDIPVDIGGSIGGNFESELSNTLTLSSSNLNEATLNASNTLRNTRKTRIVETSESGTENRNTRKIVNENRCHTVNYDYFEVLENYWVMVRPVSAEYVVKVPLPDLGPITAEWLLCHEHPLRRHLKDALYEAGFDAAKLLRSAEIFQNMITPPPVVLPPADDADTSGNNPPDLIGDQLRIILNAITEAAERLEGINLTEQDWIDIFSVLNSNVQQTAFRKFSKNATRDFILSVYTGIFDRIDELADKRNEPGETLLQHFDIFLNQMMSAGIMNIVTRPVKWEALQMLVFSYDDEGLIGAIQTAQNRVSSLQAAVNAQNAAAVALPDTGIPDDGAAIAPPLPTPQERLDQEFGLSNLAAARVELERLICHIKDNMDYYLNILYLDKGLAGLQEILASCPQIAQMVETRVINISGGYAVFVLNRQHQDRYNKEDLNKLIEEMRPDEDSGVCVTLPTKGTVLEARLGECSACEPFIENHRLLDLDAKALELDMTREKIRLQKAEADRYEARLASDPQLLDDPAPPASAIEVAVNSDIQDD